MLKESLDERDFELINIVGAKIGSNQRDLSHQLSLSLGMTNMLIRRLVAKGYIRIQQLNKRKVEYILTPKGFAEKMRKSIKYTKKTINSIGLIKNRLNDIFKNLHDQGKRDFLILGDSDLSLLVEMVLRESHWKDCSWRHILAIPQEEVNGMILICKEEVGESVNNNQNKVDLITELAKNHDFYAHLNID